MNSTSGEREVDNYICLKLQIVTTQPLPFLLQEAKCEITLSLVVRAYSDG